MVCCCWLSRLVIRARASPSGERRHLSAGAVKTGSRPLPALMPCVAAKYSSTADKAACRPGSGAACAGGRKAVAAALQTLSGAVCVSCLQRRDAQLRLTSSLTLSLGSMCDCRGAHNSLGSVNFVSACALKCPSGRPTPARCRTAPHVELAARR